MEILGKKEMCIATHFVNCYKPNKPSILWKLYYPVKIVKMNQSYPFELWSTESVLNKGHFVILTCIVFYDMLK